MKYDWYTRFFLAFAAALLVGAVSSCARKQDELPITITATLPRPTATPVKTELPPQPTQTVPIQVPGPEISPAQQAARDFFDLVRQGEIEQALSYWDLHAEDTRNFERLARDWHAQNLQFSIGAVAYSGFVSSGDFQDLEQDDPRITTASVEVTIGERPYYLMLARSNGDWRMNGLLVRESE